MDLTRLAAEVVDENPGLSDWMQRVGLDPSEDQLLAIGLVNILSRDSAPSEISTF